MADARTPPAPPGTRDAGAWFHVGLAEGRVGATLGKEAAEQRRHERHPVWADRDIRQAFLDGWWMGIGEEEAGE